MSIGWPQARPDSGAAASIVAASGGLTLDAEQRTAERLVNTLPLDQALGPLAPIALSPFFALTCLSGASLLADTGMLPEGIANNPLLGRNSSLNNGVVFAGLLALTILTTLPKLTKVTKPLGQAIDQIEAYSGIIAILLVQFASQINWGGSDAEQVAQVVYQAGIFSATADTVTMVLIAAFSAINIFVVNAVKFFFEFLIWLSPFPVVDAAFEAANKSVAAFLVAVYVWSPAVAMILNLVIFGLCLLIFAWVYRRAVYMRSIVGDPFFGWIAENIFQRPKPTCTSTRLPRSAARRFPSPTVVVKAFSGQAYEGIKRKARGYLIQSDDRLHFVALRFLRSPLAVKLPTGGCRIAIEQGLLSNTVSINRADGSGALNFLLTRRYNGILGELGDALKAEPPAEGESAGPMMAGRQIGSAIKSGGSHALRAELA